MADDKNVDTDFEALSDAEKEARTPRGEYKNPEMLDQGNAAKGAPTSPQPADESYTGDDPGTADEPEKFTRTSRKRTN